MLTSSKTLRNRRRSSSRMRRSAVLETLETRQLFSLLGIVINTPTFIGSGGITDLQYSSSAHTFDVVASAPFVTFPPPQLITGGGIQLHIKVDNSGNLIGSGS